LKPAVPGKLLQQRSLREGLVTLSLIAILVLTAGLYALLMVWDGLSPFALILLALVWVLHLWADRWTILPTPLDVPILALIILLPCNLIFSADPPLTLVRIDHLLLSFSLFFAIVRLVKFRKHFPALIFSLLILSIGAGLLGFLATDWQSSILLDFLSPIYEAMSRLTAFVPGASINKNTMGGALAFFPPLLLSLLWDRSAVKKLFSKYPGFRNFPIGFYKLLVFFTLVLTLAVIFLTQSRGAWLGVAAGLYVLLVWKDKRFLWAIPIGVVALFLFLNQTGIGGLSELFALLDQGQDASLQNRLDIWARIISLTRGFPVTGVGLDALNPVYQTFFNPFLFNEPPARLYHAHNSLLAVTIEMGIPALILYVALLSGFGAMAWRAWKRARTVNRVLIMGLVCGTLAHQVFGLMDAYPLGKNLGITMWIYFAVMTALYVHRARMVRSQPLPQVPKATPPAGALLQGALIGLAFWLILSLFALALLRVHVYASLLAAVVAGVYLGVMLVMHPILMAARQNQPSST